MRIEDLRPLTPVAPTTPGGPPARADQAARSPRDRHARAAHPTPLGPERYGEQGIGALEPARRGLPATVVPERLRVGLVVGARTTELGVNAPVRVGDSYLEPGEPYRLSVEAAGIRIQRKSGALVGVFPVPVRLESEEPLLVEGKRFRGALEIMRTPGEAGALTVVNDVGLEDYLKGVLPAEMVTGWPTEALKVQAVAARTYAAANMGRRASQGFDLFPTVSDQVYRGLEIEAADTTAAVDATRGEVMRYQGTLINALFFSSSGGSTDAARQVWDLDLPYIQGVKDPDESPNRSWQKAMTPAEVQATLTKLDVRVGTVQKLAVAARTDAGRARWLTVTGSQGTARVDANKFRLAAGLKSTMYQLSPSGGGWRFDGSGYGHGLGMSQWGARARALAGQDYRSILQFYYTGIELGS